MKKILTSIVVTSVIMFFYSFHMNIQAVHSLVQAEAIMNIISNDSVTIESNDSKKLNYALANIEGANEAISINVKILWLFILINIIVSIVGLWKQTKQN